MPNNKIWKKSLVVGIIVLFIGVGFQPAFANEVSITNKSEVEEDCDCQPVSNLHLIRLERMLNRLEIHTKILSVISKYNSEIAEKYQEISNRILTLVSINEESVICDFLESLNNKYYDKIFNLYEKLDSLEPFPRLYLLFLPFYGIIVEIYWGIMMVIFTIAAYLHFLNIECEWVWESR